MAILALPGGRAPAGLDTSRMRICAAPRWGESGPLLERNTKSTATLGDILAQIGLQSTEWVKSQIAGWRVLFDEYHPAVVLADYAPGAVLAARGVVPCVVSGVGFTVAAGGMRSFPPLHEGPRPVYPEVDVCRAVNLALARYDTQPIAFLPEVLTGQAQCVCTLPVLDPYDSLRTEPVLGPQLNAPIVRRDAEANEIFCYLREAPTPGRLGALVDCLVGLPNPVRAFLPGLPDAARFRLSQSGVTVHDRPVPFAEQLRRCRLVVHFGGHGIAAAALLAGVPQVVLNFDIEKSLIARALERRGVARRFDYYQVPVDTVRGGILKALSDPLQLSEAGRMALEYDKYRDRDVASDIATACERLAA